MLKRCIWLSGALSLLLAAGCSDDTKPAPRPEASVSDIGTTGDVPVADQGSIRNEGAGIEAGVQKDIGVKTESGVKPDQGVKTDHGVKPDSSVIGDTSCNPNFGAADACGGSPVGAWKYVKACTTDFGSEWKSLCPQATVTNPVATVTGTLIITSSTYAMSKTGTATGQLNVPQSCAALAGGCAAIQSLIPLAYPGATATCAATSGGGCTCNVTVPINANHSGTYVVNGGVITANPSSGAASQYYFCVKNKVLRYRGLPSNATDKDVVYVLTP